MKKRIGVVGWKTQDMFGISLAYANYFSKFGEVVVLAPSENIDDTLDLLVLPGGPDIMPSSYGQVPGFYTGNPDLFKQYFFDKTLEKYIEAEVPVFGICLGLQQLNVFFGGDLKQDMIYRPYSSPRNEQVEKLELNVECLTRYAKEAIHDFGINLKGERKVNSMHHQCIGRLSESFDVIAHSKEYKNVECIFHKDLPVAAVQWHPEELESDFISFCLIRTLLNWNLKQ